MSLPHSNEALTDLLGLVDQLTLRHQSHVTVPLDGGGERVLSVMHDPLLVQLKNSVLSSTGAGPGGGALPSERNVLNTDAMELYDTISTLIVKQYGQVTDAKPFKTPEQNLRQWYIQFSNNVRYGKVATEVVRSKLKLLAELKAQIDARINPPSIIEITAPCPRCEAAYGQDDQGVYRHAVIVESRINVYRSLDHTRAKCVACGAVWIHGRGMRQLRWEIDQAEQMRHAEGETIEQVFDPYVTLGNAGVQTRPFLDGDTTA